MCIIMKKGSNNLIVLLTGTVLVTYLLLCFCLQAQSNNVPKKLPVKRTYASQNREKTVIVNVSSLGRDNPFRPYKSFRTPAGSYGDIPPPPMLDPFNSDQLRNLVEARVNGILYDPYGKSVAIINVKGSDYMVNKNDSIFGFYVENISKNQVTLSYGNNRYSVSVGGVVSQSATNTINSDPVVRNGQYFGGGPGYRLPTININGL